MNILRKVFTLAAAVLITTAVFAQLSDQQVVEQLKQYRSAGMTQEQVLADLASKGVTREQLERIKAQYDAGQTTKTGTALTAENRERTDLTEGSNQVIVIKETATNPNEVYGRDLFSSKNLTFQPSLNLPTPESYQLGAGDEVIVDIWGNSELTFRQKISPDGNINVPNIGPIYLNGLQIKEASAKIKKSFSRIYSDLSSSQPGTYIKISLGNIRSIQVNIMGEVVLPGTYTLSSFATVFHALYSAGGVNKIGSMRDIKLFRGGKLISTIDVYEYLLKGESSGNMNLREGDLVKVETYKKRAQILGEVKRPMIYELKESETLASLISYSGNFNSNAYRKNLSITRSGESDMKVFTIEFQDYAGFLIQDGDIVTVGNILDRYENRITISGTVFRPGTYALGDKIKTLKDLVTYAEGPKEDAFLGRTLLYRENPDLTTTIESINLADVLNGKAADIILKRNDRFYVPSMDEMRDDMNVTLQGEVHRPGNYPYAHSMTIADLILQGGGLLESASRARIDVSRRIKNSMSITESPNQSEVFSFSLEKGLVITGDKEFTLRPFDIVTVRRSPGYEVQQNVTVRGEILFDGIYSKTKRDERISSLIQRAGGVTSSAYIHGARLTRVLNADEKARVEATLKLARTNTKDTIKIDSLDLGSTYYVGIDLTAAMANPGGDEDIVLREGDVIDIPTYNGTVKISGAVMYPNAVTYIKGMTIGNYISNAGGLAFRGSKSKVYVVYMNGKVSKGLMAPIEPGCEIVVPTKPERKGASIAEIMGITTSATSIALMVTTLLKP